MPLVRFGIAAGDMAERAFLADGRRRPVSTSTVPTAIFPGDTIFRDVQEELFAGTIRRPAPRGPLRTPATAEAPIMTEPLVYLNGRMVPATQAHLAIFDLGIVLGATVTEMTRTFHLRPWRLGDHLDRLYRSLKYTRM